MFKTRFSTESKNIKPFDISMMTGKPIQSQDDNSNKSDWKIFMTSIGEYISNEDSSQERSCIYDMADSLLIVIKKRIVMLFIFHL